MAEWLDYTTDWGYWINPDTFQTPRIKKSIKVGSVIFIKERETLDDGRQVVVTTYGIAQNTGINKMGKKEVSEILASQMLEFMKAHNMYPPCTKMKKAHANGSVDLQYSPTDYDSFIIRLPPNTVGGNVEDFLYSLDPYEEKDMDIIQEPWRIEPAKSGRASCRMCSLPIQKGELRVGKPTLFEEHITYGWHHLECIANLIRNMKVENFSGFQELDDAQKQELRNI